MNRREYAVLVQQVLSYRMFRSAVSHITILYDMQNAFWSPPKQVLLRIINKVLPRKEADIVGEHLAGLVLAVQPVPSEPPIFLRMETGVPPGGVFASELFSDSYNHKLDQWLEQTEK
jgi:hypothetical protein